LQAKKLRTSQLTEIKEKKHLNKLICSKISDLVHKELTQVKFAEKVHQTKGIDSDKGKLNKSNRKKNKNSKIRFKASSTPHLKEELLDFLVTNARKLKKVNQNWQYLQLNGIKSCNYQIQNQTKTLQIRYSEKRHNQTFHRLNAIANSGKWKITFRRRNDTK
jgi:hypothetical protein